MIIFLILGGVAVDSSNAWRTRAELQYTADAAALAGAVELPVSPSTVKDVSIAMAQTNMAPESHGNVLLEADVAVGVWNGVTFVADAPLPNSVRVVTRRESVNSNRLRAFFLRLIGVDGWDVNAIAIAAFYFPECLDTNTIYAGGIVDFKSNHYFKGPVCVHGEEGVKARNQNTWGGEDYFVDISVGEGMELWMPESDPEKHNPYIQWREESLPPKLTNYLGDILEAYSTGLTDLENTDLDEYVDDMTLPTGVVVDLENPVLAISKDDWNVDTYTPGALYDVTCTESAEDPDWDTLNIYNTQTIVYEDGTTEEVGIPYELANVGLITNCKIKFGSDNYIHDAFIGSTAGLHGAKPHHNILHLGSNNQIGVAGDGCDPAGNVILVSTASITTAAGTNIYGAQFLAQEDIHIAAGAEASFDFQISAGNDVFFAANSDFGISTPPLNCDDGFLEATYFRLVY
jgi:hypothetical protein